MNGPCTAGPELALEFGKVPSSPMQPLNRERLRPQTTQGIWKRKAETLKKVEYKLREAQASSSEGSQDNNHQIALQFAKFAHPLKQVKANWEEEGNI